MSEDLAKAKVEGWHPEDALIYAAWRTGRKVGRTIYAQRGDEPNDTDPLIGVMDTPEIARLAALAPAMRGLLAVAEWWRGEPEDQACPWCNAKRPLDCNDESDLGHGHARWCPWVHTMRLAYGEPEPAGDGIDAPPSKPHRSDMEHHTNRNEVTDPKLKDAIKRHVDRVMIEVGQGRAHMRSAAYTVTTPGGQGFQDGDRLDGYTVEIGDEIVDVRIRKRPEPSF